jgi:hypothetical protein
MFGRAVRSHRLPVLRRRHLLPGGKWLLERFLWRDVLLSGWQRRLSGRGMCPNRGRLLRQQPILFGGSRLMLQRRFELLQMKLLFA